VVGMPQLLVMQLLELLSTVSCAVFAFRLDVLNMNTTLHVPAKPIQLMKLTLRSYVPH
jgi:hypothetical protein